MIIRNRRLLRWFGFTPIDGREAFVDMSLRMWLRVLFRRPLDRTIRRGIDKDQCSQEVAPWRTKK